MVTSEKDYEDYTSASTIHYNEPFSILLVVSNHSLEDYQIEFTFADENPDRYHYEYLDSDITADKKIIKTIELKSGQTIAYPIHLRVIQFKNNIYLPNFQINIKKPNNQHINWISKPVIVNCTWVGLTKLLGSQYCDIVIEFTNKLINQLEFGTMILAGSSGTGKSRILSECCCPLLKNGYKILELNVTLSTCSNDLIKEIIYFIYELQPELITDVIENQIQGKLCENLKEKDGLVVKIFKMIKSLDSDIDTFMKTYKELLFEKMSSMKIAFIVDNMQFAHEYFQKFWLSYAIYSVNQNRVNKTLLLTSFNLDYITEDSSKTIYELRHSNIKHLVNRNVDGFKDVNQGILFLRELVRTTSESFDVFFSEIIHAVSLNPFNLYQVIKLMEEDGVIKHTPNQQGYILPTESIATHKWKIPQNINEVLKRRFDFLIQYMEPKSFHMILSACYLLEAVDTHISEMLRIEYKDLKYLCEHQIIKCTDRGYEFVHDLVRKYYEDNWHSNCLDCLKSIDKIDAFKSYKTVYTFYKLCISDDEDYVIELCKKQKILEIPAKLRNVFLEHIFEKCIVSNVMRKDLKSWFGTLNWICQCMRNTMGTIKTLSYYKRVYDYISNEFCSFSVICCREFRQLIHSHCDIYIQIHHRESAINFANDVISKLEEKPIHNSDNTSIGYDEMEDEYYVLKSVIYNRVFCAYKSAFPTDIVVKERKCAINKSRKFASKIKDEAKKNLITYLNDSDEGYQYYGYYVDRNQLISIWKNCLAEDIPKRVPEKTMNYYRKKVQYSLIELNEYNTKINIDAGRNYLKKGKYSHEPLIFNAFFTMAEVINNLQHKPQEMFCNTEKLLDELTDMQMLLKNNKMGDIYLLRGINGFYNNDKDAVYHAIKAAYITYNQEETSYYWIKRDLIKENIITAYSILEINKGSYDISFLPNEYIELMATFSRKNFNAKGIIQTKDHLFNLPLVV
jgi:hypothetical protein